MRSTRWAGSRQMTPDTFFSDTFFTTACRLVWSKSARLQRRRGDSGERQA